MKPFVIILFIGLGLGDLIYGLYQGDTISMVVGPLIIGITIYIALAKKNNRGNFEVLGFCFHSNLVSNTENGRLSMDKIP